MNLFFKLILQVFNTYYEQVAVISNNTSYSYKDIFTRVYLLTKYLKAKSPTQILSVGLIASNSVEWIIVFLAVILSGNRLILISPLLSKAKLRHVLLNAKIGVIFTDLNLSSDMIFTTCTTTIVQINQLETYFLNGNDKIYLTVSTKDIEFTENIPLSIIVYTPRTTWPVTIPYSTIVKTLDSVGKLRIFEKTECYLAYSEFTYNYIISLLLPLIEGTKIIIPNEEFTEYTAKWQFAVYQPEIIILNAYQFEQIWREFIEPSTNELLKFLLEYELNWLRKRLLKRNIKNIFPNMKKLIILNSSISITTESVLKSMKIPYTVTYGTVETCGITTYSDPKNFKIGTVGKIVNPIVNYIHDTSTLNLYDDTHCMIIDDSVEMDEKGNVIFLNRSDESIETEFGFIVTRDAEKVLKGLPLVTDCVLVKYNNELVLLVNIDTQYVDTYNICLSEVKKKLEICRIEINNKVHSFEQISRIVIELSEFKRDGNGRILREYYTLD